MRRAGEALQEKKVMNTEITLEEFRLMSLYTPGYRSGLIETLVLLRKKAEEPGRAELLDSCLARLCAMTDAEYDALHLYLDCPEDLKGLEYDDTPAGSLAF